MNKHVLRLFAIGIALSLVGLYFLIRPKTVIYCTELGQTLIAILAILIALSLVNFYLNIKDLKRKKKIQDPQTKKSAAKIPQPKSPRSR